MTACNFARNMNLRNKDGDLTRVFSALHRLCDASFRVGIGISASVRRVWKDV
jgi:hypothetical protein